MVVSSVSTGCVSVWGSKRTSPARSSARSSSHPAIGGMAPGGYHAERGLAGDRTGNDEYGAREAVLAHHREGVLEDVAIAVVERERVCGLAGPELQIVDLVEVDDALPGLRDRVHLAAERVRGDREGIAIGRNAVVIEDAQAGPDRGAAERTREHLAAHQRSLGEADRSRPGSEFGEGGHPALIVVHKTPLGTGGLRLG